jgi:hypothetical protein
LVREIRHPQHLVKEITVVLVRLLVVLEKVVVVVQELLEAQRLQLPAAQVVQVYKARHSLLHTVAPVLEAHLLLVITLAAVVEGRKMEQGMLEVLVA